MVIPRRSGLLKVCRLQSSKPLGNSFGSDGSVVSGEREGANELYL